MAEQFNPQEVPISARADGNSVVVDYLRGASQRRLVVRGKLLPPNGLRIDLTETNDNHDLLGVYSLEPAGAGSHEDVLAVEMSTSSAGQAIEDAKSALILARRGIEQANGRGERISGNDDIRRLLRIANVTEFRLAS